MNLLILGLGSWKVKDSTGSDSTNIDRQTLYAIAWQRMFEVMPRGTKVIVAENTVSSLNEVHPVLARQINREEVSKLVLIKDNSLGSQNKGAGEYMMCKESTRQGAELFEQAEWTIYFTSRYPMSFPYIFDYILRHQEKDAIVANATYLYSSGKEIMGGPENFNDVIFAMKKEWFIRYVESMDPEKLTADKMNSEHHLFNFIHKNKLNYQEVSRWGLFRYDYKEFEMQII